MENETVNLTSLICDSLNSIFFRFFSSIDNTVYSCLDNILFINSDIINNSKFQNIFGTDSTNGFLLIANSLILGVLIFYILKYTISHLTYNSIDSPYQFIFKSIVFVACINSSLWICEQIISLISLISDTICNLGLSLFGTNITFYNLLSKINSLIYLNVENFDIFTFDGIIKFGSTLCIIYILFTFSVRFILCKILILISPFAFVSLITNQFDGFFKGWLKEFLTLLLVQVFISIVLVLGFSLDFYANDILSKLTYLAILIIISKCNYNVKNLFNYIYKYSKNKLKDIS